MRLRTVSRIESPVGQHDDRAGADEAAVVVEGAEIERQVGESRGQEAPRSAAGEEGLEPVSRRHAAAMGVDEFADGDSGRRRSSRRVRGRGPKPTTRAGPCLRSRRGRRTPRRRLRGFGRKPIERLDIVDEGRAPEEALLRGKGRAMAGKPAFSLQAFEERRLLAADIGAGAAPQMHGNAAVEAGLAQRRELGDEDFPRRRIFVTQIDVDFRRFDRPGGEAPCLRGSDAARSPAPSGP